MARKCFACGRRLGVNPYHADTRDDQWVAVGSECFKLIVAAGESGYQPPQGGPRLYRLPQNVPVGILANILDGDITPRSAGYR